MKTVGQNRRENLERLVEELGTLDKVAVAAESSSVYMSQLRKQTADKATGRPREMGSAMARRLERGCGKASGWMDVDHSSAAVAPPSDIHSARAKRSPLPGIDMTKVTSLASDDQLRLEGAWLDAAKRLGFDVAVDQKANRKAA